MAQPLENEASALGKDEKGGKLDLPSYASVLVAVDASDHANRATVEAAAIAKAFDARMTATHVYAAKLHDLRFRQMEGGLPEQFREESELERQRDVHDDLITRGLSIITDSYLDHAARVCEQTGVNFERRSLEGKNYRALVAETNSGDYDLLIIGSLGLGAVPGNTLGSVCDRVARRTNIDTLVIKDTIRPLADGPIVVAIDGSSRAYGGLMTALALAECWRVPVEVIAAFDPYYHYVAFNRIAGVLSEEAGKVFRFEEQEQLHEEIIDSGLAKIYQGHLSVARQIADEYDVQLKTTLLDGKPHAAIEKYLTRAKPSLLVVGKVGIHADPDLDIGGTTENLLRNAACSILLSQREHKPRIDLIAAETISWTKEAEQRMEAVPSFVSSMARMAILRYAQDKGHTVITERIVEEATAKLMPHRAEETMRQIVEAHDDGKLDSLNPEIETPGWSDEAIGLLSEIESSSTRDNVAKRAEKKARQQGQPIVLVAHVMDFLESSYVEVAPLHWTAPALARLMKVPAGIMRDGVKARVEDYARREDLHEITLHITEIGLTEARSEMETMAAGSASQSATGSFPQKASKCPFADSVQNDELSVPPPDANFGSEWTPEAKARLNAVPVGFCRDMVVKAAETIGGVNGLSEIDSEFVKQLLRTFRTGAEGVSEALPWDADARIRVSRAPKMVRGMLIREIENWTRRHGRDSVDEAAVDSVKDQWMKRGFFHLDPSDPRSGL